MQAENLRQAEFDFGGDPLHLGRTDHLVPLDEGLSRASGFDVIGRIADLWKLPIGEFVEVSLWNPVSELRGHLRLTDLPRELDRREVLLLRIGSNRFTSRDVASWRIMEEDGGQD